MVQEAIDRMLATEREQGGNSGRLMLEVTHCISKKKADFTVNSF